jgi:hypothetical protein
MRKQHHSNPFASTSMRYRKQLPELYRERLTLEFDGDELWADVRLLPNKARAARGVRLRGWMNGRAKGLQRTIRKQKLYGARGARLVRALRAMGSEEAIEHATRLHQFLTA